MGHRLSKITTRTGDSGETGLGDGARVAKDSARIAALGDIDELNSAIGLILPEEIPAEVRAVLEQVQQDLFDLGGELSIPGHSLLTESQVQDLETALEQWNAKLQPLKEFILPGGSRAALVLNPGPYTGSPSSGWPIWARCTRIWWVRPVSSRHSIRLASGAEPLGGLLAGPLAG